MNCAGIPTKLAKKFIVKGGILLKKSDKLLLFLLMGLIIIGVDTMLAFAEKSPVVIEAERFVLKDAQGNIKAELASNGDITELRFLDEEGKKRMVMMVDEEGARIELLSTFDEYPLAGIYLSGDYILGTYIPSKENSWDKNRNSYIPGYGEWKALEFTLRYNHPGIGLTDKLQLWGVQAYYIPNPDDDGVKVKVFVNTDTQPSWRYHLGQGKFSVSDREIRAAYTEAANVVTDWVKRIDFFGPLLMLDESLLEVVFTVCHYPVGAWRNGILKLEGET